MKAAPLGIEGSRLTSSRALTAAMAAKPKPKETISII
jgi:hypothetical protein